MMLEEEDIVESKFSTNERLVMPIWGFLLLFFAPASLTVAYLYYFSSMDTTTSSIIALAVMNGSINSVIAWLTIRLDGHSNDALDHLDTIMGTIEDLDESMDEANQMVDSFTADLEEAKSIFTKVGVDLTGIELEPIAEVVEKLKENKDGFNEILDNLKEVDVAHYINQAKRIDWQSLLDSAEEIMGFVKARNDGTLNVPKPSVSSVSMPRISNDVFDEEEDEDDESFFRGGLTLSPPPRNLNLRPPRRSN
ncbi:MAG: hypothetical protein CME55_00185 [Halieaceae bacterium]|nr:hypothetical protein [Halieaceae bacterium]